MTTLILGASKGIGLSIAKYILSKNIPVVGLARSPSPLNSSLYTHYRVDISDDSTFKDFFLSFDLSAVNNIINCVGFNNIKPMNLIDLDDLHDMYKTNVFPSFTLLSHVSSSNLTSVSILILGSIWSSVGLPGRSIYGSTKGALTSLVRHASSELASRDILVNCVSPGFTRTGLTEKSFADPLIQKSLMRTMHKNLQCPDKLAANLYFLLKPYNSYITGQEIFVDSGFLAHG